MFIIALLYSCSAVDPIKIEGAWPKASWKLGQLFSVFAGNDCYCCHPADGVIDNNVPFYLSEFLWKSASVTKETN